MQTLQLENICFAYPSRSPIFTDFSWRAERGEAWAIIGPSGCGKSTLLALLAGLRVPASGRVLIDGRPLFKPRPQSGLVIQDYGLLPWASVRENAELGLKVRRFNGSDGTPEASVDYWLDRLGLRQVASHFPGQLSGGQRQRTAIARTLVLQPDLLLLDEPFSSLDAPTREALQALVLELWSEKGLPLITVTHAIEEAAILGRKILLLGPPPNTRAQVIDNPAAGRPGHRDSVEYLQMCKELRARLEAA